MSWPADKRLQKTTSYMSDSSPSWGPASIPLDLQRLRGSKFGDGQAAFNVMCKASDFSSLIFWLKFCLLLSRMGKFWDFILKWFCDEEWRLVAFCTYNLRPMVWQGEKHPPGFPTRPLLCCMDSRVGLQVLQQLQPSNNVGLVAAIQASLQSLTVQGWQVRLKWIPRNVGMQGKEATDAAARRAAEGSHVNRRVPLSQPTRGKWRHGPNASPLSTPTNFTSSSRGGRSRLPGTALLLATSRLTPPSSSPGQTACCCSTWGWDAAPGLNCMVISRDRSVTTVADTAANHSCTTCCPSLLLPPSDQHSQHPPSQQMTACSPTARAALLIHHTPTAGRHFWPHLRPHWLYTFPVDICSWTLSTRPGNHQCLNWQRESLHLYKPQRTKWTVVHAPDRPFAILY